MKTNCCFDCLFYERIDDVFGLCRRFPPRQPTPTPFGELRQWAFPIVARGGWCGEFQHKTHPPTHKDHLDRINEDLNKAGPTSYE